MTRKQKHNLLLVLLFICLTLSLAHAQYAKNGIAYVLLNEDFNMITDLPGVYRFNDKSGEPYTPWKVFSSISGAKGLSANQDDNTIVFLLQPNGTVGTFATCTPGLLPAIDFNDSCPFWLTVATPNELSGSWTRLYNSGLDTYTGDYAKPHSSHGSRYWKDTSGSYGGATYNNWVDFGGPTGVQYFQGRNVSSTPAGPSGGKTGTPMWAGPGTGEQLHADFDSSDTTAFGYRKIVLPSHFAAVARYLYVTNNSTLYTPGTQMDGTNGANPLTYANANKLGNAWEGMTAAQAGNSNSHHDKNKDQYFGCIVKMIYQSRSRDLTLRLGTDYTNTKTWESEKTINSLMTSLGSPMLQIADYRGYVFFGKWCGDNCIPGGGMNSASSGGVFSNVNVITTTRGYVYGFNPEGKPSGGTALTSMLRYVTLGGGGGGTPINISNFSNLSNNTYLINNNPGKTPADLKSIGVSSNYSGGNDFIYGSFAPNFAVQDSWWGKGGIAYEVAVSGDVKKYDFINATGGLPNGTPQDCGKIDGQIDDIAIDGDAYLYVLKTEGRPTNDKCANHDLSPYLPQSNQKRTVRGESNIWVNVSGWWRAPSTEDPDIPINEGDQKDGDFRYVTIQQEISKSIYRYKEAESSLGTEEPRGSINAGYDYWTGKIHCRGSYNEIDKVFIHSSDSINTSSLKAELAVVNVADKPKFYNGKDPHYVVVENSDLISGTSIAEDSELTFKVQGYKPYINGTLIPFRDLGNFSSVIGAGGALNNLAINNCYNSGTGAMDHDENHDGTSSGFPSNMFEATGYPTKVHWYIYQIDSNSPISSIISGSTASIINKYLDGELIQSTGRADTCHKTFKFLQPGKYIVQAKIEYHTFDNFGTANRPSDLTIGSSEKITEPFVVNVYAKDINYNTSPCFISNVKLTKTNDKSQSRSGNIPATSNSGYDFDTSEGTEDQNLFGKLTIEFDAEFFGYKNYNNSSSYATYDGIGVWDYQYYKDIYEYLSTNNIASGAQNVDLITSLTTDSDGKSVSDPDKHVYNYITQFNSSTGINDDSYSSIYNPGFKRIFVGDKYYSGGTQATGTLDLNDLKFIQWALYLRPLPAKNINHPGPQRVFDGTIPIERGFLIATGTVPGDNTEYNTGSCTYKANSNNFTQVTDPRDIDRKFHFSFNVTKINSNINVPRDPNEYVIDLELIYPRVFWKHDEEVEEATVAKTRERTYSSIVPFTSHPSSKASYRAAPVHILSNFSPSGASNNIYNQSDYKDFAKGADDDEKLKNTMISLCVRDSVKPEFSFNQKDYKNASHTEYFETESNIPIYESTGDPIGDGIFSYALVDNNPFLQFEKNHDPSNIVATNTAKNAIDLWIEKLSSGSTFNFKTPPTEYYSPTSTKTVKVRQTDYNNTKFYENDDWRIYITYTEQVDGISTLNPENAGKSNSYDLTKSNFGNYPWKITTDNWVGSLTYTATSTKDIYDGYGKDGGDYCHRLCSISHPHSATCIPASNPTYLYRLDNDPPCIGVQLIEPSDNIKWDFQLIEGVNDRIAFASTTASTKDLADCRLIAKRYGSTSSVTFENNNIPGCTNNYALAINDEPSYHKETAPLSLTNPEIVKTSSYLNNDATPKFRKGSRLLINVDIFDNCGYKQLEKATLNITGCGFATKNIETEATHDNSGALIDKYKTQPRGTYAVDLPNTTGNEIVEITVYTKDHAGNKRQLTIPVSIVESSLETRVIQHSEQKD